MCIILAEHASTSHVTYTLHHTTPNGQYPENSKRREAKMPSRSEKGSRYLLRPILGFIIQTKIEEFILEYTSPHISALLDKRDTSRVKDDNFIIAAVIYFVTKIIII